MLHCPVVGYPIFPGLSCFLPELRTQITGNEVVVMDLSGVFGSVGHCHLNDMCYKQIVNLLHDGINDQLPEPLTAGQPLFHLIGFISVKLQARPLLSANTIPALHLVNRPEKQQVVLQG
jgi:hypothetical protein